MPASDSSSTWPQQPVDVFSDASIPKAGVAVNSDAACLRKWSGLTSVDFQGLVQLEDIGLKQQGGLKALAEELLFEDAAGLIPVHVEKDMTLTISDWEQYPLSQAQITYAAMDAIVSLWLHESPELRPGTAAAKAVVVQDAAAKAAVVQDTSNAPARAWNAMAFKDIQDLRRRREDSGSYNSDATEWYNRDASEEGREDSNVQSDSSDDSCDQSEDESSATDDDDEELAATSQLLHPKSPVIPVSTKWLSECLETECWNT